MSKPVVRVVGLGPGDRRWLTQSTVEALTTAATARLRTRKHPAADEFADVDSYDDWYERADSFEELYADIAADLARLAHAAPSGEVNVAPLRCRNRQQV